MRLTRSLLAMGLAFTVMAGPVFADARSSTSTSHSGGFSKPEPKIPAPTTIHRDAPSSPVVKVPDTGATSHGFTKDTPVVKPPDSTTSHGFTKDTPVAKPTDTGGATSHGFTKDNGAVAAGPVKATPTPPAVTRSAADQAISRGQSKMALQQFDQEQRKYKAPPVGAPSTAQAAQQSPVWRQYGGRWNGSAEKYYADRRRAEERLSPAIRVYYMNPPVWVQRGPPSYGSYAASFLGGALLGGIGTAAYDNWAYGHRNDPDFVHWHADMAQQAQDDEELRAKMAKMDSRIAELEADHAPIVDTSGEIDPALVIAPQTVMMATAKEGFNWWLWIPVALILLGVGFVGLCISISRNRRAGAMG